MEAILENLKVRIAPSFGAPLDQFTVRLAARLLDKLKLSNTKPRTLKMPAGLPGVRGYRGDIRRGY